MNCCFLNNRNALTFPAGQHLAGAEMWMVPGDEPSCDIHLPKVPAFPCSHNLPAPKDFWLCCRNPRVLCRENYVPVNLRCETVQKMYPGSSLIICEKANTLKIRKTKQQDFREEMPLNSWIKNKFETSVWIYDIKIEGRGFLVVQ